jgi:hypothetical protein
VAERVTNGQVGELIDGGGHNLRAKNGVQPASIEGLIHLGRDEPVREGTDITSYLGDVHAGDSRTYALPEVGSTLPGHLASQLTDQAVLTPWKEQGEQSGCRGVQVHCTSVAGWRKKRGASLPLFE